MNDPTGVSDTSSPVSSIPGTPIGSSSDATAEGENVATASVPGAQSKVGRVAGSKYYSIAKKGHPGVYY